MTDVDRPAWVLWQLRALHRAVHDLTRAVVALERALVELTRRIEHLERHHHTDDAQEG